MSEHEDGLDVWDGIEIELLNMDTSWIATAHSEDDPSLHEDASGRDPIEALRNLAAALRQRATKDETA